ncbi:MAG TPA: hypothetical protein ENL12_02095 [Dehalococcoidia bacterium]|nr:hypothetical protein [Dehalococcoidia bacterium]
MAKLVKSAQGFRAESKGGESTRPHRLLGVARVLAAAQKPEPEPKPKRKRKPRKKQSAAEPKE